MIIKKYEAIGLNQLSTYVEIDGKRIDIEFTPGYAYSNKFASYTCKDRAIQEALEATQMFKSGRLRILSEVEKIEPPKEIKIVKEVMDDNGEVKPVDDGKLTFDKLKDLQVYLVKNHKVSFVEVRSRENALAKAKEFGLDITLNGNN